VQQFQRTVDRRGDLLLQVRCGSRKRLGIDRPVVVEAHKAVVFSEKCWSSRSMNEFRSHLRAVADHNVGVRVTGGEFSCLWTCSRKSWMIAYTGEVSELLQ